jgi:hypothetical protein
VGLAAIAVFLIYWEEIWKTNAAMGINSVRKHLRNRSFLYGLITILLLSATGLLGWTNILVTGSYYYLAQALAFGLGILHVILMYRYLNLNPGDFWKGFGITLLLMVLGAVALVILYYYLHLNYAFITFLFPFVIPYLCWQTYQAFAEIPPPSYKIWHYPVNEKMPDLDMIDLSQIEVVQFVFNKKEKDPNQINFTSKAPLDMSLGQLFFIFINDYNEKNAQSTIEFLNTQQQPYGWLFYRKKWLNGKYYFDPNLSFRENVIRPNEFIYADRISGLI